MNVTEYLASGVVELYAMNALSPEEKTEFERLLVLYPEISTALRDAEHALETYAAAGSFNPGPHVRTSILEQSGFRKKEVKKQPEKLTEGKDHSLTYKYMIAASLAALVVSTFASWFFYMRWDESEGEYSSLLSEKNELIQNYNLVKSAYDETVSGLVVMRDENTSLFVLKHSDTTLHYQVRVYWNSLNKRTYVDVLLLPQPEETMQYQLWAMSGREVTDAGVFSAGASGLQRLKDVQLAESWFVTLEPQGGNLKPSTGQQVLFSKLK